MIEKDSQTEALQQDAEAVRTAAPVLKTKVDKLSMREEAYGKLKDAIQRLELEPGSLTSDSELARLLGMSRTPVREALAWLERDLLIKRVPNRGVVIRSLNIGEVIHIMQMREALDGMAARLAAENIDQVMLASLEDDFKAMMLASRHMEKEHSALSKRLHSEIMKAAGNPFLESASNVLMSSFERTRQHSWRIWNEARDAEKIARRRYKEHMAIIDALAHRDSKRAEKAARNHVLTGLQDVLRSLSRKG